MQLVALNLLVKSCTFLGVMLGKRNSSEQGISDIIFFRILLIGICLNEVSVLVSSPKTTFPSSSLVKLC